jgi:hypothetical protein
MRFHEAGYLDSTTGGINRQYFRSNSIYDPDQTSGGHQPLYHDTFESIYDHYTVVSSKLVVRYSNTSNAPWIVGAVIDDDSTASSNVDTLCEQTTTKHDYLTPLTGSRSSVVKTMNWSLKQMLGVDPFTSQEAKTAFGSNPAEESYFVLYGATTDSSSNRCYWDATIEYEVLLTELKTPTQS